MSLLKNVALMGTSTAMRLGFGLLTFVVMARLLGPDSFGLVMLWMSVATLATLLANFGFTPYLLREIGSHPESAQQAMSEVLTAKLLLSALVAFVGFVSLYWVGADSRLVFMALLVALLADSMTEFFNVGFRATNRFADETRLASIAATLQFAIVAGTVWGDATAASAALAFMVSRIAVLGMTWLAQRRYFSGLRGAAIAAGIKRVREAAAFGVDFGLQSLFGQIDSVVLNHFAGPAAVGVYQAGMRLFNGGAQAAGILANVFLPRAARVANDAKQLGSESGRIQWAFVLVGLGFGLLLAGCAEFIVSFLFGGAFSELHMVLPWLGVLFFIRFFASSWGLVLTSAGAQSFRAITNLLQWIVVLVVAATAVPNWGIIGWVACLIVGNLLISAAYCVKGIQIAGPRWPQFVFSLVSAAMFVPFLHWPALRSSG